MEMDFDPITVRQKDGFGRLTEPVEVQLFYSITSNSIVLRNHSAPIGSSRIQETKRTRLQQKERQQLRQQGRTQPLREADRHETARLVNQVYDREIYITNRQLGLLI